MVVYTCTSAVHLWSNCLRLLLKLSANRVFDPGCLLILLRRESECDCSAVSHVCSSSPPFKEACFSTKQPVLFAFSWRLIYSRCLSCLRHSRTAAKQLLTSTEAGRCAYVYSSALACAYLCACVRVCLKEINGDRDDMWAFEEWKETFSHSLLPLNIFVHFIANKNSKSISSSTLQRALWSLLSKWPPTFPINCNPTPPEKKTSAIFISLHKIFKFFFCLFFFFFF